MSNPESDDFLECFSTEDELVYLTLKTRRDTLCGKPLTAGEPQDGDRPCPRCRSERRELIAGRAGGTDIHTETPPPYTC